MVNLFRMTVRDRYLGSSLGSFWAITNPLFMLALFTYVFGFVFKVRLPGSETTLAYVIWLISGYGPWIAMTEAITGATNSVIGASGLVKNMAFKTELLPIAGTLVGLINLAVSLVFLFVLLIWSGSTISWHVLLLPVVVILQFAFAAALGMWLSAIAVFIRDVVQILPTLLTALMFMTPIFYPFESMPAIIQKVSVANPFYQIAEGYRATLLENRVPDVLGLGYVTLLSAVIFHFGLRAFRRAKGAFDAAM
ncbi:MAG: ABC transporter permease [Candidatus Accumulibacter sp.]|nr:ABC transporter permease [Accumulibacter sp.]MCM8612116.1 ABC transporter permease [Accumulibacter sp.]